MFGLSSSGKDQIASIVEELFDNIALQLIGAIPEIKGKKSLIISSRQNYGLPELFVQAMANKPLNAIEADSLKSFLSSANGYINTLKSKAKTNIAERIDSLARDARLKDTKMTAKDVNEIVSDEMGKAKSHMKAIAEAESTKVRNLGTLMNISRLSAQVGDNDPTVYFIVVRDGQTCEECVKIHLMPDKITPRLWKFSDLSHGYHKRGEDHPSISGLHPHCRCLYDGLAPVVTERGIIPLKKVQIGDRVLTHTGKFKRVLDTFGEKGIPTEKEEDLYRIEFRSPEGKRHVLRTTPDHLMLTQKGWTRADSLVSGVHELQYLFKKCEYCDEYFSHIDNRSDKRFCSVACAHEDGKRRGIYSTCKGRKIPEEEKKKRTQAIVAAKHAKSERLGKRSIKSFVCQECDKNFELCMAYKKNDRWIYRPEPKFCSYSCRSKNITRKQWQDENHRANVSAKNKESMENQYASGNRPINIENARRALYRIGKGGSKDQRKLFDLVKNTYPDAEPEYKIDKYFADVAIPSIKTVIEWDGGGHWLCVYKGLMTMEEKITEDRARDELMNALGWHVLRYNEESGFKRVIQDIRRVALNSTSGYVFKGISISKIVRVPARQKSKTARLYDIKVEDDESFVINGVISHNCTLTYLAKGYGFSKEGRIEYHSAGFDAYEKRKAKKP